MKVVGSGVFIDSGQFGGSTGGCSCNEQFDQFVLNGLAEATFSHRNILITFEYSWLSRTAPKFFKQFAETNFAIADNPRAFNDWASKQTYIALANMMTAAALVGIDSTPMEGFQKENVEKLLSEKGFINLDEYRVSIMAAFGYRTGEPKRAKTRQAMKDIVEWIA